MNFGSSTPGVTSWAIAPTQAPVLSSVPMQVFVWSPIRAPTLLEPVSMAVRPSKTTARGRNRSASRCWSSGAEVDPLPHVGVAEEAVMVLVRVALEDRLFDFAADAAERADGVALAALGPQQDRLLADVAGAFDAGEGVDFGAWSM